MDIDPLDIDLEKDPLAAKVFKVRLVTTSAPFPLCYCQVCLVFLFPFPHCWEVEGVYRPQPISSTWYDYWGADYGTYGYNPYIGGVGIPVSKAPVAAEKPGSQSLSISVSQGGSRCIWSMLGGCVFVCVRV